MACLSLTGQPSPVEGGCMAFMIHAIVGTTAHTIPSVDPLSSPVLHDPHRRLEDEDLAILPPALLLPVSGP